MNKIRFQPNLTERGWELTITALILILIGSFFRDILLIGASVLLIGLILTQMVRLRDDWRKVDSSLIIEPPTLSGKLVAGESYAATLSINSTLRSKALITPLLDGLTLQPDNIEGGRTSVELKFKPTYFSEYTMNHLEAILSDRYDILVAKATIPLTFNVSVTPKTTEAVVEATRFLAGEDIYSLGEEPTRFRGSGFEYADTRPYVRGDSLRRLDWKATARLSRLMVKDYFVEGGIDVHIIFDGRAPDPVSHDELTEALMRSALSFARRGVKLGLTAVGVEGIRDYKDLQPFDAVAIALKMAFDENRSAAEPVYELLDPQAGGRIRRLLQERADLPPEVVTSLNDQYEELNPLLEEETRRLVIYISSLQGDPTELLNLASILHVKGWELEVIQPTRPWLQALSLEESKTLSDAYSKLYRVLDKEGVQVELNSESEPTIFARVVD